MAVQARSSASHFRNHLKLLAPVVAALALGACARPRVEPLIPGGAQGYFLTDVPFEKQRPGHCGPAALSSVLTYWQKPASQEAIGAAIYNPRLRGTLGFDLWRYARRQGLVSLELQNTDLDTLDLFLAQGVPVLINLDLGLARKTFQHYVLVVGHDRQQKLWYIHDGRRAARPVREKRLARQWTRRGRWGLAVFPPERPLKDLGADIHLAAADAAEDLGRPAAALEHVEQALPQRADDGRLWLRAGTLRHSLKKPGPAEEAYRHAIRLEPANPDPYNNLAVLLADSPKRLGEAETLAEKAWRLCQTFPEGRRRTPYVQDTLDTIRRKQKESRQTRAAPPAAKTTS